MKRTAFYARVSSDLQRKEKTIDSQIVELKKQIEAAGHILVKEYIDDGYSGARLDRPAMNQLREDIKTDLFETIYFLNTDRIARDVTYQTIIIAEILKHRKQIIINGKDYIHNPENKFTLTVLGAVSELERAKMLERVGRGKAMKLAQGQLLGAGSNIYGYDYHRKTPDTKPEYVINKEEAMAVRHVFETYAKGNVGVSGIIKDLEDRKILTKTGKNLWRTGIIKGMLRNYMYMGIRYFQMKRVVREYANPVYGTKHSTRKLIKRDKEEWIGIKVPAIISKELFEKVQTRIEWNVKRYRNPRRMQLFSGLIRCGSCGGSFFSYARYYKTKLASGNEKFYFRVAYKCSWRHRTGTHSKHSILNKERCQNMEINATVIEKRVWELIRGNMFNSAKLKSCINVLNETGQSIKLRRQRQLSKLEKRIRRSLEKKQRIIELYATGKLERESYIQKNVEYDDEVKTLETERAEISRQVPLLHKTEVIDTSIEQYCRTAQAEINRAKDFESKRQFLLDHLDRIVYCNEDISIHGSIPLKSDEKNTGEKAVLEFCLRGKITYADRLKKYVKYGTGIKTVTLSQVPQP